MEIIRSLNPILLSIIELVIKNLSGKMNFSEFQDQLADKLNETGREITRQVLEEMDRQIKEKRAERRGWQIWRRGDRKEIVTRFGSVTYHRTYYRHKDTKKYAYLVDEQVGYTPHLRVDHHVKGELVACAADLSYRKSGQVIGEQCGKVSISGQTVKRAVDTFENPTLPKRERKRVATLYIEADEDHVACQNGRSFEVRLVYIHEGWEADGKRRKLAQPLYQSCVDEEAHIFWERVWEEADKLYDLEKVEKIYLMGDGSAWIQSAKEVFPQAEFVLDRFHYMRYVRRAVGGAHKQGQLLKNAIRFGHIEKAEAVIRELEKAAVTPSRKRRILDAWKYIKNNWEAIRALYRETVSCSVEGHVSHVLSARLSSRPMGWSKKGGEAYVLCTS
ncbi:MAG: ISLre2 family transposase [Peptococcaceae bacterium MAG4]|nr:ISLre2 family transposase [Peptococcaceae bacterium MAG4]MDR9786708.1 ISLre2 family transposase [Peptococcaceae bacterium MAG4]